MHVPGSTNEKAAARCLCMSSLDVMTTRCLQFESSLLPCAGSVLPWRALIAVNCITGVYQ